MVVCRRSYPTTSGQGFASWRSRKTTARRLPEISELRGAGRSLSLLTESLRRLGIPKGRRRSTGLRRYHQSHPGRDRRPALGLIVFVGQPKSTSEYIQASSRVGRRGDAPGLIVTLFNHARARDRSHYESFRSFHEALYRWVEPMSVTPFSTAALDRLLPPCSRRWSDTHRMLPGSQTTPPHASEATFQLRSWPRASSGLVRTSQIVTPCHRSLPRSNASLPSGTRRRVPARRRSCSAAAGGSDGASSSHSVSPRGLWDIQTSMRTVEEEAKVVVWDPTMPPRPRR